MMTAFFSIPILYVKMSANHQNTAELRSHDGQHRAGISNGIVGLPDNQSAKPRGAHLFNEMRKHIKHSSKQDFSHDKD